VAVAAFLAHSLPLVLIAAVSPVLFLNASRVVEAAGIFARLLFAGGAVLCLVALGIPTMGLMGAATSLLIAADLTSRGVELALALVLIAYGAWQVVRRRRNRTAAGASPGTKDDALPTGSRAVRRRVAGNAHKLHESAALSERRPTHRHCRRPWWISIGACFVGGALIIWHVLK
jgi:hypothetical protein